MIAAQYMPYRSPMLLARTWHARTANKDQGERPSVLYLNLRRPVEGDSSVWRLCGCPCCLPGHVWLPQQCIGLCCRASPSRRTLLLRRTRASRYLGATCCCSRTARRAPFCRSLWRHRHCCRHLSSCNLLKPCSSRTLDQTPPMPGIVHALAMHVFTAMSFSANQCDVRWNSVQTHCAARPHMLHHFCIIGAPVFRIH
jgi:hypothetical protein